MRFLLAAFIVACPLLVRSEPFAPQSNVLNVRTQFGAVGNGVTDDTAAIQSALAACILRKQTVYLPNGTYRVSRSLTWKRADGRWGGQCSLVGESRAGTVLRLVDGANGFGNTAAPNAVLITSSSKDGNPQLGVKPGGNEAFLDSIRDVTIHVGANAGAQGIDWVCSNRGTIHNVTLRGSGLVGIDASRAYPGPCLIDDVEIDGFEIGYRQGQRQYMQTLASVRVRTRGTRAGAAGFVLGAGGHTLTNVVVEGATPAVRATHAAGFLEVVGLRYSGPAAAIETASTARYHLRDVAASGGGAALRSGSLVLPSPIAERSSAPVAQLYPGPARSLRLPFERAPARSTSGKLCSPASGLAGDAVDDRAAIQAVLDDPTCVRIQLPHSPNGVLGSQYALAGPLVIPCHVRELDVLDSFVVPAPSGYTTGQPMLQVTQSCSAPLTITRAWKAGTPPIGAHFIDHRSSRDLVVRDVQAGGRDPGVRTHPGAGKLWLVDYSGTADIEGTIAYALQWNPEVPAPTPGNTITDGTLTAIGVKTEQDATVLRLVRSRAELLGVWLMPFGTPPPSPQFVSIDSQLWLSGVTTWTDGTNGQGAPRVVVREQRGTEVRELQDAAIDGEAFAGGTRRWVPGYTSRR